MTTVLVWVGTAVLSVVLMAVGVRYDMRRMTRPPDTKIARAAYHFFKGQSS
ncbi:MAG TPA: hypothetical protein VF713_18880 [Thermoanaerobaculia bacterium]